MQPLHKLTRDTFEWPPGASTRERGREGGGGGKRGGWYDEKDRLYHIIGHKFMSASLKKNFVKFSSTEKRARLSLTYLRLPELHS